MGNFEKMCIKILNKVEMLALERDIAGILEYTAEMREQIKECQSMSDDSKYVDTLVSKLK